MKKAPLTYDKAMHEARKYWRDRLGSMSFDGHIALDHPRPKDGQQQLSSLEQEFGGEVNALLQRLTAGNQFLLYTTLALGLKICLYKYTGEPGAVIFSPATSEGAAPNLLPVDGTLDGGSSFKDALLATKDILSGAYKHQQYPLSRMLLDLPDERRPKHVSMIAAMAGFNEQLPDDPSDILVLFETAEGKTKATFRFDSRLYDEETIRHFFRAFDVILRQGISRMETPIAEMGTDHTGASDASGARVTKTGKEERARLDRLIEARAKQHPENVAVAEGSRVTTYKTLNTQADQLAKTLAGLSLDARKPLVILMDAGTEMIVSMLAVMKTGGAFAPIKLLSIGGSIGGIIDTLDPECIVCKREHLPDLQPFQDSLRGIGHFITVDYTAPANGNGASSLQIGQTESPAGDQVPAAQEIGQTNGSRKPAKKSAPKKDRSNAKDESGFDTACVLVDGRDGELSKSAITHAELLSLFQWLNERCGIGPQDRCLLSPGLGAGEQLYDTLGMLIAGAGVEIADASNLKDAALAERLLSLPVTMWDMPAPLMQNMLADLVALSAGGKHRPGPRNILLSGEKQCLSLADKLAQCFPDARITGLYSNSAVGIWTTVFPLTHGPAETNGAAVAQSIPGFEHRVLNKNGEPAPFHTKGELHLRRSFPAQSIKTGLRAESLGDGRLSWLRGEDHCFVKYGCCVELTKVEEILCQHEHIHAAEVITVKAEQDADNLVVAFIIAERAQVSADTVRDFLVLHDSVDFIPDRFILVDEFPLTPEGAIDSDVLIKRFMASREPKDDIRSAEAEKIHQRLKVIWLETLQLDEVDEDESFFTLGGNSLKATLLIARIKDEFSVDLSVQDFFRKPTTRAVAQLIAAEPADGKGRQKAPDFKAVSREKYRVQLPES